jgi:ATP-dependent DNA ligase
MEIGVPVLSQKAQRVGSMKEILEKIHKAWAEFKFDGTRIQLHFAKEGNSFPNKIAHDKETQKNLFDSKESKFFIKNSPEIWKKQPISIRK